MIYILQENALIADVTSRRSQMPVPQCALSTHTLSQCQLLEARHVSGNLVQYPATLQMLCPAWQLLSLRSPPNAGCRQRLSPQQGRRLGPRPEHIAGAAHARGGAGRRHRCCGGCAHVGFLEILCDRMTDPAARHAAASCCTLHPVFAGV